MIHVIAAGGFGSAVAEEITTRHPDCVVTRVGTGSHPARLSASWPAANLRILVSWRDEPVLADVLDQRSHDWGTPWFPAIMDHPRLRIGPVVIPGSGACHRCFAGRRRQHEAVADSTAAVLEHYRRNESEGPAGFLPAQVALTVAQIELAIDDIDGRPAERAGSVRQMHLLELSLTSATVIGIDGCDRCGPADRDPDRSWAPLAAALRSAVPAAG